MEIPEGWAVLDEMLDLDGVFILGKIEQVKAICSDCGHCCEMNDRCVDKLILYDGPVRYSDE